MLLVASSSPTPRYVLVRNLAVPNFNARRSGVFVQLNHFYSEVQWGSKDGLWLVAEDTITFPLTVRVYAVNRDSDVSLMSEAEQVQNLLSSSLARPQTAFHADAPSGNNAATYLDTRLVFEAYIDAGLVALGGGISLHDLSLLHNYAAAGKGILLFASESGKLFASRSDPLKSFFPSPTQLAASPSKIDALPGEQKDLSFYAHLPALPQMLQCTADIIAARASAEQIQKQIRDELASASMDKVAEKVEQEAQRARKQQARKAKHQALADEIRALEQEIEQLSKRLEGATPAIRDDEPPPQTVVTNKAHLSLRISNRLLNVRSLELLRDAVGVYPLSGTRIRGADLLATREEERCLALGHLAHLAHFISSVFDIPLRFTPIAFGSKSFVLDPLLFSHHSLCRILGLFEIADNAGGLFPLFPGKVRWKFESGVQLLFVGVHQLTEELANRFALTHKITVHRPATLQSFHNFKILLWELGIKIQF